MSPAAKFNAILASVVVFAMFVLIAKVAPALQKWSPPYQITASIVALVTSAGLYRLLALGVRWLMDRSAWVSRKVLGPHFMGASRICVGST